jgi:hypothetical protein
LNIRSVLPSDAGVYEVEVSNSAGSVSSIPVTVEVIAGFGVSVLNPGVVGVNSVANLIAEVGGGSPGSVQWYRGSGTALRALAGETGLQLRFNPVLATDAGDYTVEVTEKSTGQTVRAAATLSVQEQTAVAPEPSKAPAAIAELLGNSGLVGTANPAAAARSVAAVETATGTGGGSPAVRERQWWVYAVEKAEGVGVRRGYWAMEYVPQVDVITGKVTGLGAGRSAWIWQGGGVVEEWTVGDVRAVVPEQGGGNWVIRGVRSGGTAGVLQVGGVLVSGSDAAWMGAPETLVGTLGAEDTSPVRMRWDADAAAKARWIAAEGWSDLLEQLRERAAAGILGVPAGE